jgi:hypothetical protein
MPFEIMWPQLNIDQFSRLFDDDPCSGVGDREYLLSRSNGFPFNVTAQPICYFSGDEQQFCVSTTFGTLDSQFLFIHIPGGELRTSPTLMPPLAMSSRRSRFLTLVVLKMISSTVSFSTISQWMGLPGR